MYAKGKGSTVPSDAQAREKLALYVYEYLLHVGAQKSAQTFLSEIRWEKNITLGEPPGFLHSWWCVFWDLYCAAPERRDTCEHSSEAKAFHDYNPSAPSPLGQMPPQDGMPGGPGGMPPGFFPPFMSPRYPGGPRGPVRLPNQVDFNGPGGPGGQMPGMPNNMDMRPGMVPSPIPGPPGMGPMQRMQHPGRMPGPMNPNYGMRGPPPNSMGPGPGGMPPMSMPGGGPQTPNRPWPPNSQGMSYNSPSPGHVGQYNGPPGGGPPGTPIMPSPQDSTNSGENMYMMKPNMGPGGMGFPGMGGPEGMGPMGPGDIPPVMNGDSSMVDSMKNSPHNGPGTPREDMPPVSGAGDMPGFNMPPYPDNPVNDHHESAAILKIKESMQEEAKRFEKDTPSDPSHPDYFIPQ